MQKPMKVLIGYDGSAYADAAIDDLRRASLTEEVEALVVTVGETSIVPPLSDDDLAENALVGERAISIVNHANRHTSQALENARHLARAAGRKLESYFPRWHVRASAVGGEPATELIRGARVWKADLLVVGSQGLSAIGRLILGSVSLGVATKSACSVRIGRRGVPDNPRDERRIVVGLDWSAESERAIDQVLQRAWPEGTELRIIAVDDGQSLVKFTDVISLRGTPSGIINAKGLTIFAEIKKGDPATILMSAADEWRADCIFIGASGFGSAANGSTNSVLKQLATNASCSIEIVR